MTWFLLNEIIQQQSKACSYVRLPHFKDDISWKLGLKIDPDKFKKQTELHKHTVMTILPFVPGVFIRYVSTFTPLPLK